MQLNIGERQFNGRLPDRSFGTGSDRHFVVNVTISPGAPKTRTTDEPRLFEVQSDEDLFRFSALLRGSSVAPGLR